MARAQIIIEVDQPAEVAAFNDWFAANRSRLTFVSDNTGCGCCVDIYDVEGPEEVLRTIPEAIGALLAPQEGGKRCTDTTRS